MVYESRDTVKLTDFEKSLIDPRFYELQFFSKSITLENSKLWYPAGLGEPYLYRIEIEIYSDDALCDRHEFMTGKALETLTLEEVWKPIFVQGYESQFEGRLHTLHDDGRKLIGRAVTATYCPFRPDLDEVVKDIGRSEGRTGTYNQWVIDSLGEYDVPVIDMYDNELNLASEARVPDGHGARHLEFYGNRLYCVNELKSTLLVFELGDKSLKYVDTVSVSIISS